MQDCQHHILTFEYHNSLNLDQIQSSGQPFLRQGNFIQLEIPKLVMSIYVVSPAVVKGACMVLKAVLMMCVLINGEVIACQGEKIANQTIMVVFNS